MLDFNCTLCDLAVSRSQIVWGSGPIPADIVFIGEAPGKHEDLGGLPFVGAAGKVLDEFLAAAGLKRSEIYITNVVKCRPPNNRNPHSEEIEACRPYLDAQLEALSPKLVITLGNFATQTILNTRQAISSLQGQIQQAEHFQVLPLYHPAATIYDRSKIEPFLAAAGTIKSINIANHHS